MSMDEIYALTQIDPWFLFNFQQIVDTELEISKRGFQGLDPSFCGIARSVAFQTSSWLTSPGQPKMIFDNCVKKRLSLQYLSWLTPVPLSSNPTPRIITLPTNRKMRHL